MSDISSIKIGDTIYSIKDNIARNNIGTEFPIIYGTQTATTGAWTGVAPFDSLVDGQKILYFLPFAGSGNATLDLTLPDGSTTGAKNVYYASATRMTTHYGAGNFIPLTYHVNFQWGTSTTKYTGWWTFSDRTTDIANNVQVSSLRLTAGANGIFGSTLVMRTGDGLYESIVTSRTTATTKTKNPSGFYLDEIFSYGGSDTITSGNTTAKGYLYRQVDNTDFRYNSNCGSTLVAYKPIYLVGTITNGLFYLDDVWWTQTLPTTQDGRVYIYIGEACGTVNYCLSNNHHIFHFINGSIEPYVNLNNTLANFINRDRGKLRSDNTVHNQNEVLWGTDFDDLIDSGLYVIRGNSSFPTTNAPPEFDNADNACYVLVMKYTSTFIKQIALSVHESNNIYVRTRNNNGWNPWSSLITTNGTNNETGTFTLIASESSGSTNYHTIEHIDGYYQLINEHFVYITAKFKITTTENNDTCKLKLSGLPFARNATISKNIPINIRPDRENTGAIYAVDACIANDNCVYIYSRKNDGKTQLYANAATNDIFYISGTYAI